MCVQINHDVWAVSATAIAGDLRESLETSGNNLLPVLKIQFVSQKFIRMFY